MKGLHPIAAFLIIIMVVLFLYMELQQSNNPNVVTSVTKTHARRHREEGGSER